MAVYSLVVRPREGDTNRFYDVLLPFLTGKPLESSLWEAEEAAARFEGGSGSSGDAAPSDPGAFGGWASPQRSDTAYVRCILHTIRHLLKSQGMSVVKTKQLMLALRAELLAMVDNDL